MNSLEALHFTIYHNNKLYTISATPYLLPAKQGMPLSFEAVVDGKSIGDLNCKDNRWENDNLGDDDLLERIGSFILSKYQQASPGQNKK